MKAREILRKSRLLSVVFFFAVASVGAQSGALTAKFFDVGQADAILITCPKGEHRLLIDAADTRYPGSAAAFKKAMESEFGEGPKVIATVIASHPHADHIGNMKWVLENFEVGTYVDNGQNVDTATYGALKKVRDKLRKSGKLNYINGKQNSFEQVDFCPEAELEIFEPWAKRPSLADTNDRSVGVRLTCLGKSFLFVGDMHDAAEEVILNDFSEAERNVARADVLKVGHHGSDTSSSDKFVHHVRPEIAIISCGKKDVGTNVGYKHPRLSTVRGYFNWFEEKPPPVPVPEPPGKVWAFDREAKKWRQQTRPAAMWLTPKDGTVTLTWDGQTMDVTQDK